MFFFLFRRISKAAAWFTYDTTVPHYLHSYFTLKCLHSYLSRALFLHLIHLRLKLTTFIEKVTWTPITFTLWTFLISSVLLLPSFLYKNTTTPLSQNHFPVNLTTFMVESVIFFYYEYGCATRSAFESTFWIHWCENKHSGNEFWQMMNSKLWFYIITVDSR